MHHELNQLHGMMSLKKGARGVTDDSDFGEVHEVGQHFVLTQKGVRSKENFSFRNTW
jgi:hypothetical protein